jgi:hypothetical protein
MDAESTTSRLIMMGERWSDGARARCLGIRDGATYERAEAGTETADEN